MVDKNVEEEGLLEDYVSKRQHQKLTSGKEKYNINHALIAY